MEDSIRTVYILRGLPGSGKSTLATLIQQATQGVCIELDRYHVSPEGVYCYNPDPLFIKSVLEKAFEVYEKTLAEKAYDIIIDCCNEAVRHVNDWKIRAERADYRVMIIQIPHENPQLLAWRNIHYLDNEHIKKKLLRFEKIGYDIPFQRFLYRLKIKKLFSFLFNSSKKHW